MILQELLEILMIEFFPEIRQLKATANGSSTTKILTNTSGTAGAGTNLLNNNNHNHHQHLHTHHHTSAK